MKTSGEFDHPQETPSHLRKAPAEMGGFLRRMVIALDRGDLAKVPFGDDIKSDSRLLMSQHPRTAERHRAGLTFDSRSRHRGHEGDGRLVWMVDGFTMSSTCPNARHYRLGNARLNYIRNRRLRSM